MVKFFIIVLKNNIIYYHKMEEGNKYQKAIKTMTVGKDLRILTDFKQKGQKVYLKK